MSVTVRKAGQHTYGDYLQWPEDRRCELIDGVSFAMAPAPSRRHQRLVGELFPAISDALEGSACEANDLPPADCADSAEAA